MTTENAPEGGFPAGENEPQGGFPAGLETYVIELTVRETDHPASGPDSLSPTTAILAAYARELAVRISTGYRGRLEVTASRVRLSGRPERTRVLNVGDTIEFREAGPDTDPDASAVVESIGDNGSVMLRFPGGEILGYIPGVIELALATGVAVRNRS